MQKLVFVVAVAVVGLAWAATPRGIVQGTGTLTYVGKWGDHLRVQCISIDGGTGQKVFVRPTCDSGSCSNYDGGVGLGDEVMDFSVDTRPFPVELSPTQDRIQLGAFPASTAATFCTVSGTP